MPVMAPDREQMKRAGGIIRAARYEKGWIQEDLAAELGVSVATISQYERGYRKRFSKSMAMAFEEILEIPGHRLLVMLEYEKPPEPAAPVESGRTTLSYGGAPLAPESERQVLDYIDWIRSREDA